MAELYLFQTGRFYPLSDGLNSRSFIAPVETNISKPVIPSSYILFEHIQNLKAVCSKHDGYILCPYYRHGDYQLLVTGKSIYALDQTPKDAVVREIIEEAGIRPLNVVSGSQGYNVNINDCERLGQSLNIYGQFQSMSSHQFATYERSNRHLAEKINVIIYGQRDEFITLYDGVIIKRPKFAESDIIGFLIIPTKKILADLV